MADAIVFPREHNPHWPLPPDYEDLGSDGRRHARINACRMASTPQLAAQAWDFYIHYYLVSDPASGFDPAFYPGGFDELDPFHIQMVESWETHRRSLWACPRGSGKSVTGRSYIIKRACCNPGDELVFVTINDGAVVDWFDRIKSQLSTNERIIADFGKLEPARTKGLWGSRAIRLTNNVRIRGFSIDGKKKGPRIVGFGLVDDPEQDDPTNPRSDDPKEYNKLDTQIRKVIHPMLSPKSKLGIICTIERERSFCGMVLDPDGTDPGRDPAFRDALWFKRRLGVEDEHGRKLWSNHFTAEFIEEQREVLGYHFDAEFLNRPTSGQERLFNRVPVLHHYRLSPTAGSYADPLVMSGTVEYTRLSGSRLAPISTRVETGWEEFVRGLFRVVLVDYKHSDSGSADDNAVHVLGMDQHNDLFSLDLSVNQLRFHELVHLVWQTALRWQVSVVGAEAYPIQEAWYDIIADAGQALAASGQNVPSCKRIEGPFGKDKGWKIGRLKNRWDRGQFKLPEHLLSSMSYRALDQQIRDFTLDLRNLRKDDAIDTVGMWYDLIRGGRVVPSITDVRQPTILELLDAGQRYMGNTQVPLVSMLPLTHLTDDALSHMINSTLEMHDEDAQPRDIWDRADQYRAPTGPMGPSWPGMYRTGPIRPLSMVIPQVGPYSSGVGGGHVPSLYQPNVGDVEGNQHGEASDGGPSQ